MKYWVMGEETLGLCGLAMHYSLLLGIGWDSKFTMICISKVKVSFVPERVS